MNRLEKNANNALQIWGCTLSVCGGVIENVVDARVADVVECNILRYVLIFILVYIHRECQRERRWDALH